MRALLVASMLLVGLLAVPSATAIPTCVNDPDPVDCNIDYAQGRANYFIDRAQDTIQDFCDLFYPPFC